MTTDTIKNLVMIALASDEELLETLVLKGGNAISLLEKNRKDVVSRTSYDIDYSIENDFEGNINEYKKRIGEQLTNTFGEKELKIIDYSFLQRPSKVVDAVKDFWGGYNIQFKIVTKEIYKKYKDDVNELRKHSLKVLPNGSPKIEIEISKYEFIGNKIEANVEGHVVFIYSPEMIVFEKLRAICQQHPQYRQVVPSHSPRPRARDFYDIYLIDTMHPIDSNSWECKQTIKAVFAAKKVPLGFIQLIRVNSDIHRLDWQSVIDTVSAKEEIRDFDFYLNHVINKYGMITFL